MKAIILAIILSTSLGAFAASETVKGAKKDFEQFKAEMNQELNEIDQKIEALKIKAKAKGNETHDKSIVELENTRNELNLKLDSVQKKSESNWKKFKKSFADSMNKLNSKVQKSLED